MQNKIHNAQDSYRDHDHTCNKKACNSLKLQAFLRFMMHHE
ncbi:hypothetical protein HMPREF0880_00885 [Yokenella regensburgei ATCC 43003]|nr:hypothetical protein HMPREF0880_00885 [Yokenella regensburgei ATCC 43003]